jgi:hypothetical protein
MFERFTEKARRVVFFARFEASQYGTPSIATEHLLLGLLREDYKTAKHLLPDLKSAEQIREQIETQITRGKRFSTSVEVPLSEGGKQALKLAAKEADRWGHRHVGTEHLLLGLLQVPASVAANVLQVDKLDLAKVREKLREIKASDYSRADLQQISSRGEEAAFQHFMVSLREGSWHELANFFARKASFVDAQGKLWTGREEISANLQALLAPFATKHAKFHLEKDLCREAEFWIGNLLWQGIHVNARPLPGLLRMTVVFGNDGGEWSIFLLQLTPVTESERRKSVAS